MIVGLDKYQLAPGWPLPVVSVPGAGDTCNWGSAVMAQSRPAEHPLMVRRKTYLIKSLWNVLLWNSFWLDGRCHDIEMQWWFISLFSKNTISKCRHSAEWQWSGVIRQWASDISSKQWRWSPLSSPDYKLPAVPPAQCSHALAIRRQKYM